MRAEQAEIVPSRRAETASGWAPVVIRAIPGLLVVAGLSQEFAGESVPGYCNENIPPSTRAAEGCDFLEAGGYTALRIVPSLIVIAFALAAHRAHRMGLIYLGFLAAGLLLVLSLAIGPSEYPWVGGSDG